MDVWLTPKMPNSVVLTVPETLNQTSNESVWLPLKFWPLGKAITEPIAAPDVLTSIFRPVVLVPLGATGMLAVA